jgi:hypothetical protein
VLRHWCGCGYGWRAQRGFAAYPPVCLALIRGRVTCAACAVVGSWFLVTGIRMFVVPDDRVGISSRARPLKLRGIQGLQEQGETKSVDLTEFFGGVNRQSRFVDIHFVCT